jgi:hypothetical protein
MTMLASARIMRVWKVWLALYHVKNFLPGEIVTSFEKRIDHTQLFQILECIQRPAIATEVHVAAYHGQPECLGMLVQIRSYMFPLVRFSGLAPCPIKGGDAENLYIESARIGAGEKVAGIVSALLPEHADRLINQLWTNQGTIRRDAYDSVGGIRMRGLIVTIQHVMLCSPKARHL